MKRILLALFAAFGFIGASLFAQEAPARKIVLPEGITAESFPEGMTVYDGTEYHAGLEVAIKAIHDKRDRRTLWCKPEADVGKMNAHQHVCLDLTVYGNGATVAGDIELDTYWKRADGTASGGVATVCPGYADDSEDTTGVGLKNAVTLKVYALNGVSVWGQRSSDFPVDITLEDCENVGQVMQRGGDKTTETQTNITLRRCTFTGKPGTDVGTVHSVYPGAIVVEGCTFEGVACPINLNSKSQGTQTVSVKGCVFKDCATTANATGNFLTYAAPIRVVAGRSRASVDLSVDGCTFGYSEGAVKANGDILLGDGRTNGLLQGKTVSLSIVNTEAEVQAQQVGDRTETKAEPTMVVHVAKSATPVTYTNNFTWDGKAIDLSWYEAHPAAKAYTIGNPAQLAGLARIVNEGATFSGKTITLAADIDLANKEWTPIGTANAPFQGAFDGNGKTISNLKISRGFTTSSKDSYTGLFGHLNSPASVSRLTLDNVSITGGLYVGAVAGFAYTGKEIVDCHVTGKIAIEGSWYIGGIAGNGYLGTVRECSVVGDSGSYIKSSTGSYVGGIWGYRGEGKQSITACCVENIAISAIDRVGGIAGIVHYGNTIADCTVRNVTVAATLNDDDPARGSCGLIAGANLGSTANGVTKVLDCVVESSSGKEGATAVSAQVGTHDHNNTPCTNTIVGSDVTFDDKGKVTGGTFDVLTENNLAEGVEMSVAPNGVITVFKAVAQIGDVKYPTLAEAIAAAQSGDTVTLLADYKGTTGLKVEAFGVTVDLNGHTVESSDSKACLTFKPPYGAKPPSGVSPDCRLISSGGQTGTVRGRLPLEAGVGDSRYSYVLEVEEGIALECTAEEASGRPVALKLTSSVRVPAEQRYADWIANGGFKVADSEGKAWILESLANALAVGNAVTLCNGYVGAETMYFGESGTLDLDGKAYEVRFGKPTAKQFIVKANEKGAQLTIRNGTLKGNCEGASLLYDNVALTLENVSMEASGGSYGIVLNGTNSGNAVTLRDSVLKQTATGTDTIGIYFPAKGNSSLTIENSTVEAGTGVQMCSGALTVKGNSKITATGDNHRDEKAEGDGPIMDGSAISIVNRPGYGDLGAITIEGAPVITAKEGVEAFTAYTWNSDKTVGAYPADKGNIALSGGTYSSRPASRYCAEGFVAKPNAAGAYEVVPGEWAVAVGEEKYATVQEAVDAAKAGETIVLQRDVTLEGTVALDKDIALDLAGHTLYAKDGETPAFAAAEGTESAKVSFSDSSKPEGGDKGTGAFIAKVPTADGKVTIEGAAPLAITKWTDEGAYDTAWYDSALESAGEGAVAFTIANAKEFAGLAVLGADAFMVGDTITLSADIDLSALEWVPPAYGFNAALDGAKHTVSGLWTKEATGGVGLFAYVTTDGVLENLRLAGAKIQAAPGKNPVGRGTALYAGAFAGVLNGTIRNCVATDCAVTVVRETKAQGMGGVAGQVSGGMIADVLVDVALSHGEGATAPSGAFAGAFAARGTLENCLSLKGEINATLAPSATLSNVYTKTAEGRFIRHATAEDGSLAPETLGEAAQLHGIGWLLNGQATDETTAWRADSNESATTLLPFATAKVATVPAVEPYVTVKTNSYFANGHAVTVEEVDGKTVIKAYREDYLTDEVTEVVPLADRPVLYGGSHNARVASTSVTMLGGALRTVYGAGNGGTLESGADTTSVTVLGGTVENAVYGGGVMYAKVGAATIVIGESGKPGPTCKFVTGGGANAGELGEDDTRVGTATVTMHSGTVANLYGGGQGYSYVGAATVNLRGGTVAFLAAGGSNGTTKDATLNISGGIVTETIGLINRGTMETAKVTLSGTPSLRGATLTLGALPNANPAQNGNFTGAASVTLKNQMTDATQLPTFTFGVNHDAMKEFTATSASPLNLPLKDYDGAAVETIPAGQTLTLNGQVALTVPSGKTLTVEGMVALESGAALVGENGSSSLVNKGKLEGIPEGITVWDANFKQWVAAVAMGANGTYYPSINAALSAPGGVRLLSRAVAEDAGETIVAGAKTGGDAYDVADVLDGAFTVNGNKLVYDYALGVSGLTVRKGEGEALEVVVTVALTEGGEPVARKLDGRTLTVTSNDTVVKTETTPTFTAEGVCIVTIPYEKLGEGTAKLKVSVSKPASAPTR